MRTRELTILFLLLLAQPLMAKDLTYPPFPESEYLPYSEDGNCSISGRAFLTTVGGLVRTAAGSDVTLDPATSYSQLWWKTTGTVWSSRQKEPPDRRFWEHRRVTQADPEGHFRFDGLPPGLYYLRTVVTWWVPGMLGGQQGGLVVKEVDVRGAEEVVVAETPAKGFASMWDAEGRLYDPQHVVSRASRPPAPTPPIEDVVARLKGLADLRDRGVLTEEEFQQQKKVVLGSEVRRVVGSESLLGLTHLANRDPGVFCAALLHDAFRGADRLRGQYARLPGGIACRWQTPTRGIRELGLQVECGISPVEICVGKARAVLPLACIWGDESSLETVTASGCIIRGKRVTTEEFPDGQISVEQLSRERRLVAPADEIHLRDIVELAANRIGT